MPFSSGSDHQVFAEGSWRIPTIYMNDWPDRYIHTSKDTADKIDPTKLKRAAFIGAASAYFLARISEKDVPNTWHAVAAGILRRQAAVRALSMPELGERSNRARFDLRYNNRILESFSAFASPSGIRAEAESFLAAHRDQSPLVTPVDPAYSLVFVRNANPKGPMSGFGYDYFVDKLGAENSRRVRLLQFAGSRGSGADYAYEVLNSVDGERSAGLIAEAVSAVYGPVPIEMVVEYLHALESIGVIREKK